MRKGNMFCTWDHEKGADFVIREETDFSLKKDKKLHIFPDTDMIK